jgi:hypothetical protein
MLTAKLSGSYRKAVTGTVVFRYNVSGTDAELKQFEDTQGDNFRLDEKTGQPLWFSTRYSGDNVQLVITENNRVVAENSDFVKIQSLVDQYGAETAKLILNNPKSAS